MSDSQPIWGELLVGADMDLMAFSLLYQGKLFIPAMYHASQAQEKYLKCLAFSIKKPGEDLEDSLEGNIWLKTCDVGYLVQRCGSIHPFYKEDDILESIYRFARCEDLSRYPWVSKYKAAAFTIEDIPRYLKIIQHLRTDIPIEDDDYPLGLMLRGYFHKTKKPVTTASIADMQKIAAVSLKRLFPGVDGLVRW